MIQRFQLFHNFELFVFQTFRIPGKLHIILDHRKHFDNNLRRFFETQTVRYDFIRTVYFRRRAQFSADSRHIAHFSRCVLLHLCETS